MGESGGTPAREMLHNSDMIMEETWYSDPQSRVCYIYDYYHDDHKELNRYEAAKASDDNKIKIDAKFIIKEYGSASKDQVEYHIMFRPSQKVEFDEIDPLYYYEEFYRKRYGSTFPIGMYIDIPDDTGVYNKWLICGKEIANQFVKYSVFPCDYYFHWIEQNKNERIKRKMWGVRRSQNSYNSGLWTDYVTTSIQNQGQAWFPMNDITSKLYYTHVNGDNSNQRIVMSAPTDNPNVWQISKVDGSNPLGIQKITLYQDSWNPNTDYIDRSDPCDIFAMYADYFSSILSPELKPPDNKKDFRINLSASTNTIKVGGSYKTISMNVYDDQIDVTDSYVGADIKWMFYISGEEITGSGLLIFSNSHNFNQTKIKFVNDKSYLTKILTIQCVLTLPDGQSYKKAMDIEITSL